jgi:hypothetical protein
MLPDITSNTWAKNIFYNFLEQNVQFTIMKRAWWRRDASALVAAVVTAATAGGAAGGAVAELVEAVSA